MKPTLLVFAFLLIVSSSNSARAAMPYIVVTPSQYNVGSHNPNSSGWLLQFTVTLYDYTGPVTSNVTFVIHHSGAGVVSPFSGTPPVGGTFVLGPSNLSTTLKYSYQFPPTYGSFQHSIWFTNQYDASQTFTSYIYYGTVIPPVGTHDYVQFVTGTGVGPSTFSPTVGSPIPSSCNLTFCPINYSAKFFDADGSGTTVTSWSWKAELYHSRGSYILPAASSSSMDLRILNQFTLPPNYDWYRDANGNIKTKVRVEVKDTDGFGHHAERLVGIKYPPNKTSGMLVCANGSPLPNKPVTVQWWDSTGMLASQSTTTDNAGQFNVEIGCHSANNINERFVIATPGCTKWTIPTSECWARFGELTCKNCSGCTPAPRGLVNWWTFDEQASGNIFGDIARHPDQMTASNGPQSGAGKVAGALCFDGRNDFGTVPDHPEVNFLGNCRNDIAEAFTIDAWIKTTGSGLHVILDKREQEGTNFLRGYSLFLQSGRLTFQMATGTGGTVCNLPNSACSNFRSPPGVQLNDGGWHFIAVTVSRCRGAVGQMYVDGKLVLTFTPRVGDISTRVPLSIGRSHIGAPNYFRGCLDELEFSKAILSKLELDAIYRAGEAGKCKPSRSIEMDIKN